jgi:hypothetical protein
MSAIHPIDYEEDPRYEQLLEKVNEAIFSSLSYLPLPEQQVYVSTADIRDTIAYWNSIQSPQLKKIKVKSEFYNNLVKVCPPITVSDAEVDGVYGAFTGIPIEIDDEIEGDYEPVYGEEN